ncbi:homogentisate 1,2-dioxygenase [Methylocystis parvus]|uniref:Homogentisate 1,2-dioxygenase n=1 Tax=Methylocystis parvus TaxID=134 RepID=A0A6B8M5Z5_9HYPH|nr:homogentisate 1,2-dioxygenase [Methylocystis parvus]QGM97836.1 homogentisate 1,2-dioxygenase [Methylocystis parvus]WBK01855.1 homogentisate 1,2-dioxygenase [Methylocystis parvus OBBP]
MSYMSGFGNEFASEALPGALPEGRNSPQRCPYGLYAEQLSGSAFTAPAPANRRSWLYRIRPSVLHARRFARTNLPLWATAPARGREAATIGPLRWDPTPLPREPLTFIEGVRTMTCCGDADARIGMSACVYLATADMDDDYFYDADGELLILPQQGVLRFDTEFGRIDVAPGEICVIPRGVKFRARLASGAARGYLCENYGAPFALPYRGAIGANGLANPRDFLTPVAAYEDVERPGRLTVKWGGRFHSCEIEWSPLDVVAWHGNYAPYKYDLRRFSPMGALLYDHPDPSIFCVLTSPSAQAGVGEVDFVIFPERWQIAEDTFRPPWFHVNVMSEFMGLILGAYDAKPRGFAPGGMSLHNAMLPHGPDAEAFAAASSAELRPSKLEDTLAFMFETRLPQHPTDFALALETLQRDYAECWTGLRKRFQATQ